MDPTVTAENPGKREILDVTKAQCCVVGAGPAGMMLSYLLARQGIAVTLLESHKDFNREFRGDTVHPSTLEILDSLGLVDGLLKIPHAKMHKVTVRAAKETFAMADFHGMRSKFPYIALIPQSQFLDYMADEGRKLPSFHLVLGANVKELVQENGVTRGVRYQGTDGWHEVLAPLTVAADGRFSKVRSLAGLEPVKTSPPMDVLWFALPKLPADPSDADGTFRIAPGKMLIRLDRNDHWQFGYIIPKGGYQHIREQGIEAFRAAIAELTPDFPDRASELKDWTDVTPLVVESSLLRQWHRPGLLLIGDAAHVMSPVGGVGINYAIQDAVETSNLLAEHLRVGDIDEGDVATVQRVRELPIRMIQAFQSLVQRQIVGQALDATHVFKPPRLAAFPPIRWLINRLVAYGPRHVRVKFIHEQAGEQRVPGSTEAVAVS